MNSWTQTPVIPQKDPECSLPGLCQVLAGKGLFLASTAAAAAAAAAEL
jgi:hypothetical protein